MLFISISERNFHRYSTIHPAFTEHVIDLTGNPNLSIKKNLGGLLAAHWVRGPTTLPASLLELVMQGHFFFGYAS